MALVASESKNKGRSRWLKISQFDVSSTVNRLIAVVEGVGGKVFAWADHAAGAMAVGENLRPTRRLGMPLMQVSQSAGLDLPMRVVVYEDADGTVTTAYHDPVQFAETHGVPADLPVLQMVAGVLGRPTSRVVSE